jgi:PAS domain S-box-containing protein
MKVPDLKETLRPFLQPVTYLGVAMLVFLYCALTYLLITDKKEDEALAIRRTTNIERVVHGSVVQLFNSAGNLLLLLREAYQNDPSHFDLTKWARKASNHNDLINNFTIVDAAGRVAQTSFGPGHAGADASKMESFLFHSTSASDQLLIGKPFISSWSHKWTMIVSRRITATDGTFIGVAYAIFYLEDLANALTGIDLGPNGSIAIVGLDGYQRVRIIDGKLYTQTLGRKFLPKAGVLAYTPKAPEGVHWNTPGLVDNVKRLLAYRVAQPFSLVSLVTISEDEVFRRADHNARIYWSIALFLTVTILLAVYIGYVRERRLIDTTNEYQESQTALQASQERYRLVEAAVNDGIWDWNIETGDTYNSPRWKALLGYSNDELPNHEKTFFDNIHPDDKTSVSAAMQAHLQDNRPFSHDIRLRHKDGEYRWYHSRGMAIRNAAGRATRVVGTITDISNRKRTLALLEDSRTNLARAEKVALLGHYKLAIDSDTFEWSAGCYRIYGKSPDTFVPKLSSVRALIHPEDRASLDRFRAAVWAEDVLPPLTLRVVKDDGQIVFIEALTELNRAGDGSIIGRFGTYQDITLRKKAEEIIAHENMRLEQLISERTSRLRQEMRKREEAQEKLAQVLRLEAVGQLTAGIAHDFNNLLGVTAGSLEIIREAAAKGFPADPELIDAAARASQRGADLVRRLLTFSRQAPLQAEATSVDQIMLDTLQLLHRTLGENIEIKTQLQATGSLVNVDRNQLANALVNLALNARDAMPNGGRLTITTACKPSPWAAAEGAARWPTGEAVCISVSDNGTGMTEEVRKRAFEPFFSTKPNDLGAGLGLSMVHGFVEQSGGHIEISDAD